MSKKFISYLLLVLISTQTALAGIDVHMIFEKTPTDILHHYVDEHIEKSSCELDSENKPITNTNHVDEHNHDAHHGCSGHIVLFNSSNSVIPQITHVYQKINISLNTGFISVSQSPLLRPPIS